MSQAKPRKTRSTRLKKKGKISVKQSVELRKRGASTAKQDTLQRVHSTIRDNAVSFKVKIKKK